MVAPVGTGVIFCDFDSEEILSLYATSIDETSPDPTGIENFRRASSGPC